MQTALTVQTITDALFKKYVAFIDAKPRTLQTYRGAVKQLLNYLNHNGITQPTRETILAYRDELKQKHKPTTVQNYIVAARLFFKWTAQERLYPNVAENIKGAKLDKEHKKDCLTNQQVKHVLNSIKQTTPQGIRDYAIILLMVTGGLRDIEIHRADAGDLRTIGSNTMLYIQGKGREEKTEYIILSEHVIKAVRANLATREAFTASSPLFISLSNNSKGERLSTRTISGIVKARLKAAGYDSDRLTAHSLRHTAVTLALLAGKNILEVQQFARHTNINTTQIYNHAIDRMKNSCGEAIANAIFF